MDLKMDSLDYDLFKLAYVALQQAQEIRDKCDMVVMQHLERVALSKGLSTATHRFNLETRSFELKPDDSAVRPQPME